MALEGLPEELMTLILVKLPVKSLLRCKCVRKSWYALIISLNSSASILLLLARLNLSSDAVSETKKQKTNHDTSYPFTHMKPLLIWAMTSTYLFPVFLTWMILLSWVSSLCPVLDGLVCLTNHTDQIFICNPATRELRSLFVPPSGYHIDSVAFGFDPNTAGKYKVVMIGVPYDEDFDYSRWEDRFGDRGAQVYDFSTNTWRETAVVIPGPFSYLVRVVSLNGAFHWCPKLETWRDNYVPNDILTFHLSDEEVTESIPMPDFVNVREINSYSLVLCVSSKSQLSLVYAGGDMSLGGRFEICVMTEYGVKESWTRLFQIGPLFGIYSHLKFWDDQQLLLPTMLEGQLVSCDLQHPNHLLRYLPIYDCGWDDVYSYSESLVSVNGSP